MTLSVEFPETVDNTMMSAYKECPRSFWYSFCLGRRSSDKNIHLAFGDIFAKAMETARRAFWAEHLQPEECVLKAVRQVLKSPEYPGWEVEDSKSLTRCAHAVVSYFDTYGFSNDYLTPKLLPTGPALEFNFAVPLPINHPETGYPLIYTGRYDMWGEHEGVDYLEDDKTAKTGGAQWEQKWDLRGQFLGYLWGHRQYRPAANGMVVRSPIMHKGDTQHLQVVKYYSDEMISDWYQSLLYFLERMISDYQRKAFPRVFGDPCASYGGCSYKNVCLASSAFEMKWLETEFPEVSFWRPMERFV